MTVDGRSRERLRAHYEIERELADRLRDAEPEARKTLYGNVYDELFAGVPDHPQLTVTTNEAQRRRDVDGQLAFLTRFLEPDTVFLELGAGDCALALAVATSARRVYALDVSESITAEARAGGVVQVVLSDGVSVDVPEGSVTLAYGDQLMEHLHPDDARVQLRQHQACAGVGRALRVRHAQSAQRAARHLDVLRRRRDGIPPEGVHGDGARSSHARRGLLVRRAVRARQG